MRRAPLRAGLTTPAPGRLPRHAAVLGPYDLRHRGVPRADPRGVRAAGRRVPRWRRRRAAEGLRRLNPSQYRRSLLEASTSTCGRINALQKQAAAASVAGDAATGAARLEDVSKEAESLATDLAVDSSTRSATSATRPSAARGWRRRPRVATADPLRRGELRGASAPLDKAAERYNAAMTTSSTPAPTATRVQAPVGGPALELEPGHGALASRPARRNAGQRLGGAAGPSASRRAGRGALDTARAAARGRSPLRRTLDLRQRGRERAVRRGEALQRRAGAAAVAGLQPLVDLRHLRRMAGAAGSAPRTRAATPAGSAGRRRADVLHGGCRAEDSSGVSAVAGASARRGRRSASLADEHGREVLHALERLRVAVVVERPGAARRRPRAPGGRRAGRRARSAAYTPAPMATRDDLRNIAIVAHVDHGKTTLVDAMLWQSGAFRANQDVAERVMDSIDLEREKGITILAKNTAVRHGDLTLNIVDTPGPRGLRRRGRARPDDGRRRAAAGRRERGSAAADPLRAAQGARGAAADHPGGQQGRPAGRALAEVVDEVYALFLDLDATTRRSSSRSSTPTRGPGSAALAPDELAADLEPLFETIAASVPPPDVRPGHPLQALVTNLDASPYVGRLALCRVRHGSSAAAQQSRGAARTARSSGRR